MDSIYCLTSKILLMDKEEKAKVILDYDKYQELLKRVNEADKNDFVVANNAYAKAKQEDATLIGILREKIASLEKDNSDLRCNLSYLQNENVSLRVDIINKLKKSRLEGYSEFVWVNGDKILDKVMRSLDMSLKTIPALSFWNYFTGKADRIFCDKIRSCVCNSLNSAFLDFINPSKIVL